MEHSFLSLFNWCEACAWMNDGMKRYNCWIWNHFSWRCCEEINQEESQMNDMQPECSSSYTVTHWNANVLCRQKARKSIEFTCITQSVLLSCQKTLTQNKRMKCDCSYNEIWCIWNMEHNSRRKQKKCMPFQDANFHVFSPTKSIKNTQRKKIHQRLIVYPSFASQAKCWFTFSNLSFIRCVFPPSKSWKKPIFHFQATISLVPHFHFQCERAAKSNFITAKVKFD